MEYAVLNNGVKMPMEGFGVFQVPDSRQIVHRGSFLEEFSSPLAVRGDSVALEIGDCQCVDDFGTLLRAVAHEVWIAGIR